MRDVQLVNGKKKFYFLTGFHRSGNTLLSSILNQNPEIYSSPISPMSEYIWRIYDAMMTTQQSLRLEDNSRSINLIKNSLATYYEDVDKPIIFDREKSWSVLGNIEIIKEYIDPDPKFIMTVRPILEILASFINIWGDKLDSMMFDDGWVNYPFLSKNDNKAEYLLSKKHNNSDLKLVGPLMKEHRDNFYFVEYDELVNCPEKTLNGIYDFLSIERFTHDFNNIFKIEKDNDLFVGDPENMHYIHKTITKSKTNPEELFSTELINKYKDTNYWRNA